MSLAEALVCVAILALIVALAAPDFRAAIDKAQMRQVQEELTATLATARAQAITTRTPALLQRLTDCDASGTSHKDWSCGWQLVMDSNRNHRQDPAEPVLQSFRMPGGLSFVRGQNSAQLVVTPWGSTIPLAERFVIEARNAPSASNVVALCLSSGGRVRTVYGQRVCAS